MKGKLESMRKDGTAVKIGDDWIKIDEQASKFARKIPFGAEVEFKKENDEISFIEQTSQTILDKTEPTKDGLAEIMAECVKEIEKIYLNNSLDEGFKEKLDISSHINSLFIAKTRGN